MKNYYKIPEKYFHRIHFVRPRFKGNMENVLLYMATECCKIAETSCREYSEQYTKAIRMFPGNLTASEKTIDNWRTEIPALFAFYEENKTLNTTKTSKMARFLNENQDLTQFLKFFLQSLQFPGGHLKAKDNLALIEKGIRFKPTKTILQVLLEGNAIFAERGVQKEMSISAEEAAYCIFNDTRVTTGKRSVREIAHLILENRERKLKYYRKEDQQVFNSKGCPRSKGDVNRYAGDILFYMEIACLVEKHNGYYYLAPNQINSIRLLASDTSFFKGYEPFYGKSDITIQEISHIELEWFKYVNDVLDPNKFKTDVVDLISSNQEISIVVEERIKEIITSETTTTKEIGNIGEALIHGHETIRLKVAGYPNLAKLVQIVDSPSYHPGYDIDSFEGDAEGIHRYIEVKTTISRKPIKIYNFHMSPNEWSVARTHRQHYCVYRLMLSLEGKKLFILRDPVGLDKKDKIMALPREGMEVSFDASKFKTAELLMC